MVFDPSPSFSENFGANFDNILLLNIISIWIKNLQHIFLDQKWPSPVFGTFPKILPFWLRIASLSVQELNIWEIVNVYHPYQVSVQISRCASFSCFQVIVSECFFKIFSLDSLHSLHSVYSLHGLHSFHSLYSFHNPQSTADYLQCLQYLQTEVQSLQVNLVHQMH